MARYTCCQQASSSCCWSHAILSLFHYFRRYMLLFMLLDRLLSIYYDIRAMMIFSLQSHHYFHFQRIFAIISLSHWLRLFAAPFYAFFMPAIYYIIFHYWYYYYIIRSFSYFLFAFQLSFFSEGYKRWRKHSQAIISLYAQACYRYFIVIPVYFSILLPAFSPALFRRPAFNRRPCWNSAFMPYFYACFSYIFFITLTGYSVTPFRFCYFVIYCHFSPVFHCFLHITPFYASH